MMRKMMVAVALVASAAMAGSFAPAVAEKPVDRHTFTEIIDETDPFAAAGCGVDQVDVDGTVKVQLNFFADGTARIHENLKITLSNPDTGDTVHVRQARKIDDAPVSTEIDENGILTEVFETTFTGLAEKWRIPGEGVIARDAGRLSIRATVTIDLVNDVFLGFEEEVLNVNGPHPIWFNGPPFDEVCRGLGGELIG